MKKTVLTLGLFSLMMILTSFTSPEIGGQESRGSRRIFEIGGQESRGSRRIFEIGGQESRGSRRIIENEITL
ncbi:MAG: hypothetical protein RLZ77_749 [Bacteroidota bacterium]